MTRNTITVCIGVEFVYVCKTLFKRASLKTSIYTVNAADFHEGRHTITKISRI